MDDPGPAFVEAELFREVIGRFASGVTVVTVRSDGVDHGSTASAISSLCLDPPMLIVCLNRTSRTGRAIRRAGAFAVNILEEGQGHYAERFATAGSGEKFRDV